MAMLLADAGLLSHVEIVATDLSLAALGRAREHGWPPRSMRSIPPAAGARWLRRDADRVWVDRTLLDSIRWRKLNLLDDAKTRALGSFDASALQPGIYTLRLTANDTVAGNLVTTIQVEVTGGPAPGPGTPTQPGGNATPEPNEDDD